MENLPSIFVQREKYPFLPDDVFMPIEAPIVPKEISGRYGVNKRGEMKNLETGRLLSKVVSENKYIRFTSTYRENGKPKSINSSVHRMVASVFLNNPNPNIYNVVNHINNNRGDNTLNNLEWVTPEENWRTDKVSLRNTKFLGMYVGYILDGKEVERFYARDTPSKYVRSSIESAAIKGGTYKGMIWKYEKPNRIIPGFSGNLDDYEWYEHWKYPGLYVCKKGFIKIDEKLSYYSDERNTTGYVHVSIKHKTYPAHRIIMEYILGRNLEKGEIVDHIDRDRKNNHFDNLKLCNNKENMNNINTIKYISNTIIVCNLYGDIILKTHTREAYEFIYGTDYNKGLNLSGTLLSAMLCKKSYICIKEGDNDALFNKLKYVYFIISKDKTKIIKTYTNLKDLYKDEHLNSSQRKIYRSLKSNTLINNYYVLNGQDAWNILKSIGHLTALDPENNQPLDM